MCALIETEIASQRKVIYPNNPVRLFNIRFPLCRWRKKPQSNFSKVTQLVKLGTKFELRLNSKACAFIRDATLS